MHLATFNRSHKVLSLRQVILAASYKTWRISRSKELNDTAHTEVCWRHLLKQ